MLVARVRMPKGSPTRRFAATAPECARAFRRAGMQVSGHAFGCAVTDPTLGSLSGCGTNRSDDSGRDGEYA